MKREQIKSAIGALTQLFFSDNKNQELGLQTLEYFVHDLKFLKDIDHVAKMIEQQQAYALIPKLRLFDNKSADEIEVALNGLRYTNAELIASDIEFEKWKKSQNHCQ
ncbi:hypothetical protein COF64_22755 [Bacillus sp. AFS043905]|nr:hypothetical protein COF64_22755 [Bacillus sp. AFS043905]